MKPGRRIHFCGGMNNGPNIRLGYSLSHDFLLPIHILRTLDVRSWRFIHVPVHVAEIKAMGYCLLFTNYRIKQASINQLPGLL